MKLHLNATVRPFVFALAVVALAAVALARPAVAALVISETTGAPFALPASGTGASELSGITHAGGNQYYAVSDENHTVYPVSISINSTTGAITSAALSSGIVLSTGSDLEGIAYDSATGLIYVSDETGPFIRRHSLVNGSQVGYFAVPLVYSNYASNRSLESLTRGAGAMWTANEEALTVDGPLSTLAAGTKVRLQKFDSTGAPAGQWAYFTDPIPGPVLSGTGEDRSGVSDLVALPDGRLLVLERGLGGNGLTPYFRNAIYLVDVTSATDTSGIPALSSSYFNPASKTLLWQRNGFQNYEGITLGPMLDNGDYTLILISDDQGVSAFQSLYSLRLSGVETPDAVPEPSSFVLVLFGMAALAVATRKSRRPSA